MKVPRRKVRGEPVDPLYFLPPLKLRESVKLRLPHLSLFLHERSEFLPFSETAPPFGFIAHNKMRHCFGHPPRFQRVFQLLRRHLTIVVPIDRLFNLCNELACVDLRSIPHKLRPFLIRHILLGRMDMAFEHVDRADAAVIDQFETWPLPRTPELYVRVAGIADPTLPFRAVLRTYLDIPPIVALVVDRDIAGAKLAEFGAL
ncbi:hypothetical protein WI99_35460 [Burkholderia cepacia]|nr:hypothetical protein WI99_35460 [Burkholderia cepacia]